MNKRYWKSEAKAKHLPVIDGTQSSWTWMAGSESASAEFVLAFAQRYAGWDGRRTEWAT